MIIQGKVWDVAKNQPLYFPVSERQKVFRTRLEYPGEEVGSRPCVRLKNKHLSLYTPAPYCIVVDGQYSFNVDIPADSETSICLGYARDQHSSGGIRDQFRCGEFPSDSPLTIWMIPIGSRDN